MSFSQNSSANRFVLVGAVVAPLAGIAYYLSRRKTAQGGRAAPVLPAAIAHVAPDTDPQVWSAKDVHRWLASIGAAEEVMAAFYRDGVDGVTLPLLQDSHLEKMGIVSVSQRVRALREIRVLFNFPITESVANTPGVSPTASLHRQRHVAAAPVAESEEVPAVTARHVDPAAPSSQEAQTHAITTLAGKMQRWYHVLTSAEFAGLALNEQQERVAQAARELAAIARLLQTLPPSPPVQELKALAAQLMDVISAANEVIEEAAAREAQAATAARQPPPSADGMHNQAAAEKVAELLIQFEKVLRSPEISSVPEQQRRDMARGIGDQLVKIRENVVPALPENQRDAFRDKCDALLEICVKLQSDPRPMGVRQPGIAQGCCGGAAHEHEAAVAMAQADQVSQTDQPQPASLNFIITRMRGVFDVIRSPQFMQEADPERLRASIADAAKEVHQLTLESQHLPADQQEVVHQVAKNIMDVLSKMAQAVQQARQQSTAAAPAVGQRPMAQPRAAQQHATNGSAEADQTPAAREVEVAQQMSRQLVAMLNVLKSDEFEAAPPLQRRALANRMQNDLAVMNERLATQPPQLREMLEPTVAKLCDFVAAVLSMTAEPAEIASRAAAPAAQAPAPSAAGIDAAQQISKQLVAMLNVLKSVEFEKASPDQKRQLALRVKNDLQSISERLRTQPPKIQELLAPTHAKLEEFVGAVLEMTANLGDAAPAAQQGPTANDVDVARGLSKQLVNMLGLLKSKEFDEAPLSAKREVAVAMRRDLEAIGARVRDQPREIQELVEPTRAKIANFVDAIIAMADEEASFKQPKPESPQKAQQKSGKSPSKAAQAQAHAQAQAQQQEREPSPALLLLMRQLNQVAEIVTGDEFDTASNSKKLDVIVQCQQLLGSLVQRVADLDGVEQTVAMSQANKLNHLLKSIADPILAAVDEAGEPDEENDGEEPQENSAADGTSNAAALNVVQRTQRLFQMINDDSFLDSEPAELRRKAAVMKRELQEITAVCARLDAAQRSDLIPVIRSLADILDKVEAAATVAAGGGGQRGDDDEEADEDAGNEGGDDDAAQQDARRNKIYRLAQEMTAALLSGQFTVEDIAGVEQLSTLLSLLDSCGISNENELRIREQYQNAVERAVSNLSRRLGGDPQNGTRDDGDDGEEEEEEEDEDEDGDEPSRVEELPDPPQPPVTRLRPVESRRVDAVPDDEQDEADEGEEEEEEDDGDEPQQQQQQQQQNQQNEAVSHQLEQIIARLNSASSPADLERIVPVLADLSRSQVAGRDRRHLALISQAVGLLQRKRAEFAQAAKTDLRPLKNTLRRIIVGLRTANETQISALITELTAATDATDAWKQDQEATNLVNAAIAEVSAAVKRLEGRRGASSQSSEQSPSRTIQLITEATRRVREGRDPTQFLPLAVELSRRRPQLTEQEAAALDDFERALQEVRSMGARTTSTSSDDLLTPPNTPASPAKPVQRQPAPAPLAQAQPEDGNEDVEEEEEAEEEEAVDEEEDHERTILDVVNKIKQRVEATDPKSFQDLAPFIAILQRLRQGPSATPAVDRAVTEVEDLLRAQVAKLKAQSSELREEQLEHKRRMINELYSMLNHAHFGSLDPEARNTVMRKATALLKSLDANEQTVLHDESQRLLEALMTATEKEEEANEESEDELSVNADLALLPRIVERLGTADFMENCSTFEIQAIARTLSRLEVAEFAEINAEFKAIVKNATKLLADRASSFTGSAKDAKAVSTPLNLTGMDSETDQGHAVVRYTLFSSEEEEDFTPNEVFVNRFKRSPVTEATLPESGVESWRGKSVAILFVFEQSPLDAESVNQTAHAEANQLTDVLEADQGFEVIRVWGTPTPRSVSEALAGLAGRDLKRLFIYVQNPAVKAQLPPVPEHAIVFEGGQVLKHNALLSVAKEHSEHVVVFHDNGSSMEIVCSFKGEESAHVGVSVTEAGFLVANSGRCWLYDGLFTPILIEALSIGKRTLCPEDLVNTSVRVLSVTDGSDGPYLTDSPSTARAFFAPGLEASE